MKKFLLTTAAVTFAAVSAQAADLRPAYKAPPVVAPAPVMTWTGCYLGAGGGYGFSNSEDSSWDTTTGLLRGLGNTNGGRGWFATVGGGCDYQVLPNWVIGAFADVDFASISGDASGFTAAGAVVGEEKLDRSWAAGGRVGYLPFAQLLAYVSGGFTQAHYKDLTYLTAAGGVATAVRPDRDYSGWFIGSGYEYNLGWLPGLTWKTEYRFADYGSATDTLLTPAGALTTTAVDSHKYVHTVRSELVYRFNWGGAPVVAKY